MANSQVTWKVTSQAQASHFESGSEVTGKDVSFEASTGYKGTLFVPDTVYRDASAVKELIGDEVAQSVVVGTLSGTV